MPSLERCWLFARLAVPADGCPDTRVVELVGTVLTDLVTAARRADPGTDWFFDRYGSPAGPRLSLGFHAAPAALDAVRTWLLAYDPRVSFAADPYAVRDAARGGPLAWAGSDMALPLLDGESPWLAGVELPLAVAHLRHLTGLVPADDRLAFLFMHWQDRSQLLTGAQRRDLAAQADADAEKIVLAAGDLPLGAEVAAAWQRYLDRVADVIGREQPATPRGFLLAHHAQLTHERWGIGPDVDSLAALALRLSMVRDRPVVPSPRPVPQRRQQPHARVGS
ncbi:lantibiotic dehydratase C-terminal domain-containing protein [Micromonospora sp. NPDC048170]|uniref:lantibiotic dehydratase C-terminal domain-containing protein n=1 Tax=Micromonospora sp. NPDC048170 TaxID=3154819 RepID=UPI0033EA14D4